MRDIIRDGRGTLRFKENRVVRILTDEGLAGRPCDLNRLHVIADDAPMEDWEEFYQLIGYSVSGFGDQERVRPEIAGQADEMAREVL